jgi:hypothetical protein
LDDSASIVLVVTDMTYQRTLALRMLTSVNAHLMTYTKAARNYPTSLSELGQWWVRSLKASAFALMLGLLRLWPIRPICLGGVLLIVVGDDF